jgi:hypothetical protein
MAVTNCGNSSADALSDVTKIGDGWESMQDERGTKRGRVIE